MFHHSLVFFLFGKLLTKPSIFRGLVHHTLPKAFLVAKFSSQRMSDDESLSEKDEFIFDNDLDSTQKFYKAAERVLTFNSNKMKEAERCPNCYLTRAFCLCQEVRNIFKGLEKENRQLSCKLDILMHYKEWARASNTGKLLAVGAPDCATIRIFGKPDDEQQLIHDLTTHPSLILYPSADAVPISQYSHWLTEYPAQQVRLCVIDSTWPQSKAMVKSLSASIPRVKIDEMIFGPSKFLNRKQSKNASKVSTIEAVIMALRALGEHESVLNVMHSALEYSVDSVLRQAGRAEAFGNIIVPHLELEEERGTKSLGPVTAPSIAKPLVCLLCGHTPATLTPEHIHVNTFRCFKNTGVRKRKISGITEYEIEHFGLPADMITTASSSSSSASASVDSHQQIVEEEEGGKKARLQQQLIDFLMTQRSYRLWKCLHCQQRFPGPESVYQEEVTEPHQPSTTSTIIGGEEKATEKAL